MFTKSYIGYVNNNGIVIGGHFLLEGSPSHNGFILVNYYQDINSVEKFLAFKNFHQEENKLKIFNAKKGSVVFYNTKEQAAKNSWEKLEADYCYLLYRGDWIVCYRGEGHFFKAKDRI